MSWERVPPRQERHAREFADAAKPPASTAEQPANSRPSMLVDRKPLVLSPTVQEQTWARERVERAASATLAAQSIERPTTMSTSISLDALWAAPESVVTATLADIKAQSISAEQVAALVAKQGDPRRRGLNAAAQGLTPTSRGGSVGMVGIYGLIEPSPGILTARGGTNLHAVRHALKVMLADPEIETIVMVIDSPGGIAQGLDETAELIRRGRQQKRIIAWSGGMIGSAAYWLASAASEVILTRTAEAGSIGVVATYIDTRKLEADIGIERIEIISSQSPNKRPDPKTDEGRARWQGRVDALAAEFIADVAAGRGMSAEDVQKRGAGGDMLQGALAVEAGLADRVMFFDDLAAELMGSQAT